MSDHTPCHIFRKANDGKCYNCGFTLSEHQRLERIRDAAPDMYEAGKLILEILDHPTRSVTALDADKLRAALAKAEAQ